MGFRALANTISGEVAIIEKEEAAHVLATNALVEILIKHTGDVIRDIQSLREASGVGNTPVTKNPE